MKNQRRCLRGSASVKRKQTAKKDSQGKPGSVRNWAFAIQSGVTPPIIEVGYILIHEGGNLLSMIKSEVKIAFFLHLSI